MLLRMYLNLNAQTRSTVISTASRCKEVTLGHFFQQQQQALFSLTGIEVYVEHQIDIITFRRALVANELVQHAAILSLHPLPA